MLWVGEGESRSLKKLPVVDAKSFHCGLWLVKYMRKGLTKSVFSSAVAMKRPGSGSRWRIKGRCLLKSIRGARGDSGAQCGEGSVAEMSSLDDADNLHS